jgi:hypothetical protein
MTDGPVDAAPGVVRLLLTDPGVNPTAATASPRAATTPPPDKRLKCWNCPQEFIFTGGDQAFFTSKGFPDPSCCATCEGSAIARAGAAASCEG